MLSYVFLQLKTLGRRFIQLFIYNAQFSVKITRIGRFWVYLTFFIVLVAIHFTYHGWFWVRGYFWKNSGLQTWMLDLGVRISYLAAPSERLVLDCLETKYYFKEPLFSRGCTPCAFIKALAQGDESVLTNDFIMTWLFKTHLAVESGQDGAGLWGYADWTLIPSKFGIYVYYRSVYTFYFIFKNLFFGPFFYIMCSVKLILWGLGLGFINGLGAYTWDMLVQLQIVNFYFSFLALWHAAGLSQWVLFNLFSVIIYLFITAQILRVKFILFYFFLALVAYWGFLYNFDGIIMLLLLTELTLILVILLIFLRLDLSYKTTVVSFKIFKLSFIFLNFFFFFCFTFSYKFYSIFFFNYYSAKEYIVASDFFIFFNFFFLEYSFLVSLIALLLGLFSIFFIFIFFTIKLYSFILVKKRYTRFFIRRQSLIKQAQQVTSIRAFQAK